MPPGEGPSIKELTDQINTIAGLDVGNGEESTQEHQSLKKYVDKLTPEQKESVGEADLAVKTLSKAEGKLKKEITKKEATPSHNEIAEIYENSALKDRINLDIALIKRAFEANGKAKLVSDSSFPELKLDHVDEWDPTALDDTRWDEIRAVRGTPKIFFTSIYEEKGFFRKEPKNTGQVLVVMSMNNGSTSDENTVVTMLVKHDGGKLLWGDNNLGLYRIQSEREYRSEARGISKTADALLARGELTIEKYKAQFAREEHKPLEKYWTEKDAKLAKLPPGEDAHRGEEVERRQQREVTKKEMLAGLGGEYTRRLQELRKVEDQIIELTRLKVAEVEARNAEIIASDEFKALIYLLKNEMKNNTAIALTRNFIIKWLNVAPEYLDKLILDEMVRRENT